jgi:hypothetical protein
VAEFDEQPLDVDGAVSAFDEQPLEAGPGFMQRLGTAAGKGARDIIPSLANTAVQGARGGIDLLGTLLQRPSELPGKLMDVGRGAAGAATLGAYQPDAAGDPAREALQSVGGSGMAGLTGMGVGKLLGGVASPLLRTLMGTGISAAQGGAGAAVQGGDVAEGIGRALGGQATLIGGGAAGGATLRKMASPAAKVVQQNEANQAFNTERAAKIHRDETARARAHVELVKATTDLDNITNELAVRQGMQVVSPFAKTLAAPVTDREAYSFLKAVQPSALPSVPLNNLQTKAQEIIDRMTGVPKSIQPGKVVGTAKDLATKDQMDPTKQNVGGTTTNLNELSDLQKEAFAPLLKLIESHNKAGGIALDKLQDFKTAMGTLTQATSGSARRLGSQLYRSFMDDIRETAKTSPAAQQYLVANAKSAQNHAAIDIADAITLNGTQRTATGKLVIKPGAIAKAIEKDELMAGLPADKRQRLIDTIEEVFQANRRVEEAEAGVKATKPSKPAAERPTGKKLVSKYQPGLMLKTAGRTAGAAIGGAAAGSLGGVGVLGGMYLGDKAGQAAAAKFPQMIFRAALTEPGTAFIKQLFAQRPPMFGDTARATALQNFLQAQDFNEQREQMMVQAVRR